MAGRPTKYNAEMQAKTDQYIEDGYRVIPSRAGLALHLGVARFTITNWANEHPDFKDSLDTLDAKQEMLCLEGGLSGEFKAPITKLVLSNHGYTDRVQTDHTSSDGSMTPGRQTLDDFYAAADAKS